MAERIRTETDVAAALAELVAVDARLAAAAAHVPEVPLRLFPAGLEGLLRIVSGQQLSVASASALHAKVRAAFDPLTAEKILAATPEELRAAGLSRQKAATFRAIAEAVAAGLDLEALATEDIAVARGKLEAIRGIGRWSADIYLMFCAGHPDIMPVGDLAVRKAAQRVLGLAAEPTAEALDAIAVAWTPHRSTAARLLWAYYRVDPAKVAAASAAAGFPL